MKPAQETVRTNRPLTVGLVALVLVKLWLVSGLTVQAIGPSGHDDRLFLSMTSHILQGHWLGDYNQMTLAKGPFYSLFAAGAFVLGVPLFTAQHLLYALACAVLLRALRPLALGFWTSMGLFTALLFNPTTYENTRVLRQNITPAMSLFILAALIALYLQREAPLRRLIPWALLLGATLSAFSLTREDGIWIAPALLLPWAMTGWLIWRSHPQDRLRRLGVAIGFPLGIYYAVILTVCCLNWHHYGIFTTCEFRVTAIKKAYGALTRVAPSVWHPYIPVSRETRERIYAVSPAFAELRPELEGQLGFNWANNSRSVSGLPPEAHEIAGGWFIWALRDAVAATGHARSGAEAQVFYTRLANEVNAACDQGLLKAGPARASFLSPWHRDYNAPLIKAFKKAATLLLTFSDLTIKSRDSEGSPTSLLMFADLTREPLSPVSGTTSPLIGQNTMNGIKLSILRPVAKTYHVVMPWLVIGAILCFLTGGIRSLRRGCLNYWSLFSTGLLGSWLALVLICALVDTTSFPAIYPSYMTGAYGFLIFFVFTGTWTLSLKTTTPQPVPQ